MDPASQRLIDYYSARAPEYDGIYEPRTLEHGKELTALRDELTAFVRGKRILELACGTGYWTQFMETSAASVLAVDASPAMLDLAGKRCRRAELRLGDAYAPPPGPFDAVVAIFWLSHVPRARMPGFFATLPKAARFFADNTYVPGEGGELLPGVEDTWKRRGEHVVLKNYFSEGDLRAFGFTDVRLGSWIWRATSAA